jgi:hypothetical protein
MCFVLYVASRTKPKLIAWDKEAPGLCTQDGLDDSEMPVVEKFSLPIVTYVGSDQGCGCGFRNIPLHLLDNPDAEEMCGSGVEKQRSTQHNHQALVHFLREQFATENFIEIYGCLSGEVAKAVISNVEIPLEQITDRLFCFRERGFYRVMIAQEQGSSGTS